MSLQLEAVKEPTPEEVLQSRIEAAGKRREAVAKARKLADLEREASDAEALAALEEAHPEGFAIVYLNAPPPGFSGFVAASDCPPIEYKRYQAGIKTRVVGGAVEVESKSEGAELLARKYLIHPSPEAFAKLCELRAGVAAGLGQEVVNRAQTRKAEEAKK